MTDAATGGVTIDTRELETTPEVPLAQTPEERPEAVRSPEGEATADKGPSLEELQEQLSREKAAREKAEKAAREEQSRRMKIQSEYERTRQETLERVNAEIAELKRMTDYKIQQGELVTQSELDRRDALLEQRFALMQNTAAYQDAESKAKEYGSMLRDVTKEMGWDDNRHQEFLRKHSVVVQNPLTGQPELRAFGMYNDPEQAFEAAQAFLHYETRDQYQENVRKTEMQKADELRKKQIRAALPGGTSPKPQPPPDPQQAYKDAIMNVGKGANPDDWF